MDILSTYMIRELASSAKFYVSCCFAVKMYAVFAELLAGSSSVQLKQGHSSEMNVYDFIFVQVPKPCCKRMLKGFPSSLFSLILNN